MAISIGVLDPGLFISISGKMKTEKNSTKFQSYSILVLIHVKCPTLRHKE